MQPASSTCIGASAAPRAAVQWSALAVAAVVTAAVLAEVADQGWRIAILFVLGILLGVTLYHAAFGFTSAYRRLFVYREVSGIQAQLVMLGFATLLFAPVLAVGSIFGQEVSGAVAPAGWQVAIGAFLFGIGMQLGGGCGSGALYTVGGGNLRMGVTLAAFVTGSFWASLHMGWWQELPSFEATALGDVLGWPVAVALQLAFLIVLTILLRVWGKDAGPPASVASGWARVLRGPWPIMTGAALLAVLNFATLTVAGHPWTITWAFTLWGAKAARILGWDPQSSPFWTGGFQQAALEGGILEDITSLMDIGLVLGALAAASLAGRFAPRLDLAGRPLLAAGAGGLLMGYGARIAFGCNVGAFFSGVASTSLHGWLWIVAALAGNWIGVRLRPRFSLQN